MNNLDTAELDALYEYDPKDILGNTVVLSTVDPNQAIHETTMREKLVEFHYSNSPTICAPHYHRYCEIIYFASKTPMEYLVGSQRFTLYTGDILYIPANTIHCALFTEDREDPYTRYTVWVREEYQKELASRFPECRIHPEQKSYLIPTTGTKWSFLESIFMYGAKEFYKRKPGWQVVMMGHALQLLPMLDRAISEQSQKTPSEEKPDLLLKLIAYIDENYMKPITLQDVASQFFISKSTISHLFSKTLGTSFYRYVTQRRLVAAEKMIQEDYPLEQICEQVGFADYPTFYRAFKQCHGISPRQYKKAAEQNISGSGIF